MLNGSIGRRKTVDLGEDLMRVHLCKQLFLHLYLHIFISYIVNIQILIAAALDTLFWPLSSQCYSAQ